jgi:DNA-directed RNA polymerase subunit RPC12/RpoP
VTRASVASVLTVLYAAGSSEVEFNCPWCNTKLALPRNDFANERAVLCPRCNNPIDLDIQRRLVKAAPSPAVPAPAVERRRVTAPTRAPPPPPPTPPAPPRYSERPAAPSPKQDMPPAGLTVEPITISDIDKAFGSDATRLGDVDALTGGRAAMRSVMPLPGSSQSTPSSSTGMGTKLKCPSCSYENSSVPAEFSFGTVQKCAWCGKPLPK